jgi:hypothetical protein
VLLTSTSSHRAQSLLILRKIAAKYDAVDGQQTFAVVGSVKRQIVRVKEIVVE